jgi:putative ATPase
MTHVLSLSERFRPKAFDQFFGQERWLQENGIIRRSVVRGRPASLLFWGPPGCGKTSLAGIYLSSFPCPHVDFHPTRFQSTEVKRVIEEAISSPLFRPTIFWIDEIHRLTRPQQDLLLRAVEDGTIVLVAATTENPSFVLSNALLSRMTVLTFAPLREEDLFKLLDKVIDCHPQVSMDDEAKQLLVGWSVGDARKLLSLLEPLVEQQGSSRYDAKALTELLSHHVGGLTSEGEGRYFLISALHKAVRGSDCQAALYWLARLLTAGEDPLYLARRLIRMSIEDVGLADPQALSLALSAQECYRALGSPEGELALAEVTLYLALAPKSASSYVAFDKARAVAAETSHLMPPAHILNAPTRWMKEQGFSKGYAWDHDCTDAFSGQEYFPEGVEERTYFIPVQRGFERDLERRLEYFQRLREQRRAHGGPGDKEV